jgi:hypothetical protein
MAGTIPIPRPTMARMGIMIPYRATDGMVMMRPFT